MNQLDECMYCGFDKDLTDEHIIPFGMGGDLILKKSSCKKCNEKTSKEELKVLRGFMYDGRLVGNLPSRRKKKRPKKINRVLLRKDGTESNKELLVSDGIAVIHLPLFSSPGLLAGQHPQEGIALRGIDTIHIGLENLSNLERAENVSGIKFGTRIDPPYS